MSSQQHHGMDNSGHPASYYLPKSSNPLVLDSQGKIYEGLQNRGQFIEVQKKIAAIFFSMTSYLLEQQQHGEVKDVRLKNSKIIQVYFSFLKLCCMLLVFILLLCTKALAHSVWFH